MMECPVCKKEIIDPSPMCSSCGHPFPDEIVSRLSLYFDLRNDLEHIRTVIKTDVWAGLKKMSERLGLLEAEINSDLGAAAVPEAKVGTGPALKDVPREEVKAAAEEPPLKVLTKGSASAGAKKVDSPDFEMLLGQKWLLIIGIITMVFGVGYFLKYSFERGWIGPAGRVAMAYLWGIIFLAGGNQFRKKFENFGLYLIGGGIATLYFSTFAAFQLYHLFPVIPSFSIMVLITVLASVLSVVYDARWLAVLGLTGGFLTPVMLSTGQDNQLALMSYMTVLDLGLLSVAFYKRWELLNTLGFLFTYLLYAAWFGSHYNHDKFWPSIIFLNVFYMIYSVMPFAYQFFRETRERAGGLLVMSANSFAAFAFGYYMIKGYSSLEWVSTLTILYAVVPMLMASYLFRHNRQDQDVFVILCAKASLFLIITVPLVFSRHWITVFWAAQAVTVLWTGLRLRRKQLLLGSYLLLGASAAKLFLYDYGVVFRLDTTYLSVSGGYTYLMPERLVTSAFLLMITQRFSHMLGPRGEATLSVISRDDSRLLSGLFGIFLFIVLNIETSAFFYDYLPAARFASISVLWTIFSVLLMLKGFRDNSLALRRVSLGLFMLTLLKVFRFDMVNISTPYRIISFIILGVVLVCTSYLYHKFRGRIMDAVTEETKGQEGGK